MKEIFEQLTWESLIAPVPIYTIGYGGRSIEIFIELLHKYEIDFLLDIRSQPYSRISPGGMEGTMASCAAATCFKLRCSITKPICCLY